ncbi:hypothetical protein DRA43_02495 [Micromonospora provocatoris]|nr:hypothetical protein [Micromonospora provocatoris]RBJ10500.1 hypothetical protein DRA43_02495 [Micromonospora provocatoris]
MTWWRDRTTGPLYEAAREQLRATHRAEFEQLLQSVRAKRDDTPAPAAPSTSHAATSSAPQAALVLADRLTQLGWEAAIHTDVNASHDRPEARVEAARGAARLRAAYARKRKGRNAKSWYLIFVDVRVAGESPVRLPKVTDAVDLAALPEEEFAAWVAEYRALQETPTVSGG